MLPTLDAVFGAKERITGIAINAPLVRLPDDLGTHIYLKLESLQPIGSFKLRGAANAMALAICDTRHEGIYTASAGNMAQGIAWCAKDMGVDCRVIVPEHAPRAKTVAIERLGGEVIRVPFADWWQVLVAHGHPGMRGLFVHPFADAAVMAGNGTIALEIFADVSDIDVILVPYGGGGLACGIAATARLLNPSVQIYAVEVETAAPLTAAFTAGKPVTVTYTRTFIDGMGSGAVSDEMWPLVRHLLAGTVVVTVAEIEAAMRILAARCRVVAEGAGAASLAAALTGRFAGKKVACIVSGGNIDLSVYARVLANG